MMLDIIVFSDSIGTGQYVSLHNNWVSLISANLYKDFSGDIIVTNASGNGRTTRQALEIMQYEVLSKSPDILIIQFGLNDSNIWDDANGFPRVSEEAFKANLTEIVERAYAGGICYVFLTTNHTTLTDKPIEMICIYNRITRKVSKDTGAGILDVEKVFDKHNRPNKLLLDDGIHLSKEGHKVYFGTIYPIIQSSVLSIKNDKQQP